MGDPETQSPGETEAAFKAVTPEEAAEMTEEERDTLSTLRDHINAELQARHKEGETTSVRLTGFVKGKEPVDEGLVTPRVVEELIDTFSGDWNVETISGQREGTLLSFSRAEGET